MGWRRDGSRGAEARGAAVRADASGPAPRYWNPSDRPTAPRRTQQAGRGKGASAKGQGHGGTTWLLERDWTYDPSYEEATQHPKQPKVKPKGPLWKRAHCGCGKSTEAMQHCKHCGE
eukprot:5572185-Pyramimonas_sp.AAC.1